MERGKPLGDPEETRRRRGDDHSLHVHPGVERHARSIRACFASRTATAIRRFPIVRSHAFYPPNAKLGAFALGANVLGKISANGAVSAAADALAGARALLGSARADQRAAGCMPGADADSPQIGDVRVTWHVAPVGDLSVVGAQAKDAISPYRG